MATKSQILEALKTVYDPEFPISVVDLGLIYEVKADKDSIRIKMTLTNPGCPMSGIIVDMVKQKVESLDGVKKVDVELVFEPPWSPERMSKEARKKFGI
jgi:FeS assembly SUF system protein